MQVARSLGVVCSRLVPELASKRYPSMSMTRLHLTSLGHAEPSRGSTSCCITLSAPQSPSLVTVDPRMDRIGMWH